MLDIFAFDLPEDMQADEISNMELDIITNKIGDEVILRNVIFSSGSSNIDSSSYYELDMLVAYLYKNPDVSIQIQGHTDNIGSDIDNQTLSYNRAKVVFDYLKDRVHNKLEYVGYGESRPISSNASESSRVLNRRTSFVIIQ